MPLQAGHALEYGVRRTPSNITVLKYMLFVSRMQCEIYFGVNCMEETEVDLGRGRA